jgi:phage terminase small subunit
MTGNDSFSRNQERFLQALLLGKSIAASAKHAGISESTAFRWLKDLAIIAERERREATQREEEQLEIAHILNAGYAAMHRRVEALDKLAKKLESYMEDEQKIWLPDVKAVGTGEFAERVDLVTFNDALISEYRATFADLAAELGHRVKKTKQEITGKDGKPIQTQQVEIYKVRLPDNGRDTPSE